LTHTNPEAIPRSGYYLRGDCPAHGVRLDVRLSDGAVTDRIADALTEGYGRLWRECASAETHDGGLCIVRDVVYEVTL
jgi:hypothetical protein